jgi:hypothetical protein
MSRDCGKKDARLAPASSVVGSPFPRERASAGIGSRAGGVIAVSDRRHASDGVEVDQTMPGPIDAGNGLSVRQQTFNAT